VNGSNGRGSGVEAGRLSKQRREGSDRTFVWVVGRVVSCATGGHAAAVAEAQAEAEAEAETGRKERKD